MGKFIAYSNRFGGFVKHGECHFKKPGEPSADNYELHIDPNDTTRCTVFVSSVDDEAAIPIQYAGFNDTRNREIYEGFEIVTSGRNLMQLTGIIFFHAGCFSLLIMDTGVVLAGYKIGGAAPLFQFESRFELTGRNIYEKKYASLKSSYMTLHSKLISHSLLKNDHRY
jgi:hypothetical protein